MKEETILLLKRKGSWWAFLSNFFSIREIKYWRLILASKYWNIHIENFFSNPCLRLFFGLITQALKPKSADEKKVHSKSIHGREKGRPNPLSHKSYFSNIGELGGLKCCANRSSNSSLLCKRIFRNILKIDNGK
jgi:hypothetical protein